MPVTVPSGCTCAATAAQAAAMAGAKVARSSTPPSTPWYFLCFGEAYYIGVLFVVASYLRAHKLFLRL